MKVLYFFGLFLASVFLFHDAYAQNGRGREKKKARKEMADGKVTSRTQTVVPAVSKKQIKAEREALTALYHATDGDHWINNRNWLSDKPLEEWAGVYRSPDGTLVLRLDRQGLKGALPAAFFQVPTISMIDLSYNKLSGSLPAEVGKCTGLERFDLMKNELSGQLPDTWQGLKCLKHLSLGQNRFGGEPFFRTFAAKYRTINTIEDFAVAK